MTNRVLLGNHDGGYIFRVSRPGFDVTNNGLTPNQLAFDSRWSESGIVLMEGTFIAPSVNCDVTIPFGTTLPGLPVVVLRLRAAGSDISITHTGQFNAESLPVGFFANPSLVVTTSDFRFLYRDTYPYYSIIPDGIVARTVNYTVYRNFYG